MLTQERLLAGLLACFGHSLDFRIVGIGVPFHAVTLRLTLMRGVKDLPMFRRKQQVPTMHLSFQSSDVSVVKWIQWALSLIALTNLGFSVSFILESRSLDEQSDY